MGCGCGGRGIRNTTRGRTISGSGARASKLAPSNIRTDKDIRTQQLGFSKLSQAGLSAKKREAEKKRRQAILRRLGKL